jgi:hypothetical protein
MNGKTLCAGDASILFAFTASGCWAADNPMRAGQNGPGVPSRPAHDILLGGTKHASGCCQQFLNCAECHGAKWASGDCGD